MDAWQQAARDLGVDISRTYLLLLESGKELCADVRVADFGGKSGMLIFRNYLDIKDHIAEISRRGYGYSVFDANQMLYERAEFIEMLRDWGWSGTDEAPLWMK